MLDAKEILNQVSRMQFQTRNILGLEKRLRALEAGGGGGGTTDHAILTHLDYAHAGHTGFQAALGFTPVPNTRTINGHALSADVTIAIPSALADLTDDSTHRLVTDTEKATWNAGGGSADYRTLNDGRLVYTSDTVLSWNGYAIGLWNGSTWVEVVPSSTPTLVNAALDLDGAPLTYNANYDIYAQYSGTTAFNLVAKKWTNDTTQAVVPVLWQGRYVYDSSNKGRLWLGTVRLRNDSGTAKFADSDTRRLICNLYNQEPVLLRMYNTTGPYSTNTTTLRETNNGIGAVRAEVVLCRPQEVRFFGQWLVTPGTGAAMLALGVSSTTVGTNNWPLWQTGGAGMKRYPYNGFASLTIGYSYCTVLERVDSGTTTFESSGGAQGLVTFQVLA